MKSKNSFLWFVVTSVSIVLTSCTLYREFPIEIYQPGEITIPADVKKITIASRNFKYTGDTLRHYYKSNYQLRKAKNDPQNLDSMLITACLKEFAAQLKSIKPGTETEIMPYSFFKNHKGSQMPVLNQNLIKQIGEKTGTDLIIFLDTYSSFFSEFPANNENPKTNEVIHVAVWSVYNPVSLKLIERKSMSDTLFWNGYNNEGNYDRNSKIPDRKTALDIASRMAGEMYAKRFQATWKTVTRNYSIPPLWDFSQAAEYLENGKTELAITIWNRYTSEKNGKLSIIACTNLALAYELTDDLETSSDWLNEALKRAKQYGKKEDLNYIINYKKIIEKRKSDIKRLNQ